MTRTEMENQIVRNHKNDSADKILRSHDFNQYLGSVLLQAAEEAKEERTSKMLTRDFDFLMRCVKDPKLTAGQGFLASDVQDYFEDRLEQDDEGSFLDLDSRDKEACVKAYERYRW